MDEIRKFGDYQEFKQEFDREITAQAEGYLRMGYLLKVARDTDILHTSGYKTIAEFAWNEYKLSDDVVSKMIKINDKYSEGGYSDRLQVRYQSFGVSLLAEMLTLPDAVIDAIPEGTRREEIREIKKEIREEEKITPIEVMMERGDPMQQDMESNLQKVLHQYYHENNMKYREMHQAIRKGNMDTVIILAPSGVGVIMARVPGAGKYMLSIKGSDQDLELLNVRSGESETYTWDTCTAILQGMCYAAKPAVDWERLYGKPMPGEAKVAPAQPKPEIKPKKPDPPVAPPELPINLPVAPEAPPEEQEEPQSEHTADPPEELDNMPEEIESTGEQIMDPPVQHEAEEQQGEKQEIQQTIEDYEGCLPDDYQGMPEVITRREVILWKEAAISAVRLFNTLEGNDWNPDCGKVVKELCDEAEKITRILMELKTCMEAEA